MFGGKSIFHTEVCVEVIEPTKKAIEEYGTNHGIDIVHLSEENIEKLNDGKMLAFNDSEYSTFLIKEGVEIN